MSKPFDVNETMRALEKSVRAVSQELAKRVGGSLVLSTPYGRPDLWINPPPKNYRPGLARGNWRAAIGRVPSDTELPTRDVGGARTIANIEAVVTFWDGKQPLNISNAANHIVPLDNGTASRQVSRGFVARAVADGVASLDNTTLEVP